MSCDHPLRKFDCNVTHINNFYLNSNNHSSLWNYDYGIYGTCTILLDKCVYIISFLLFQVQNTMRFLNAQHLVLLQ